MQLPLESRNVPSYFLIITKHTESIRGAKQYVQIRY